MGTTTSDSILQLTASGAIATGEFVLTCTDNIANNGAAGAVTFDIVSTKDTSALTGQTGYTITAAPAPTTTTTVAPTTTTTVAPTSAPTTTTTVAPTSATTAAPGKAAVSAGVHVTPSKMGLLIAILAIVFIH